MAEEDISGRHFLFMEAAFAISIFVGCYLSYILPIHFLRKRLRVTSNLHLNLDFPNDRNPNFRSLQQRAAEDTANAERIIGWCNCFGAGIFVSVCFLGVMPVVEEEFESYFHLIGLKKVNYPVPELTTLLGFFLVLFLEEVIHSCRSSSSSSSHTVLVVNDDSESLLTNQVPPPSVANTASNDSPSDSAFEDLTLEGPTYHSHQNHQNDSRNNLFSLEESGKSRKKESHRHHIHSHSHSHAIPSNAGSGFAFFILMFATSIHSIFEGMALGLIKDPSRAVHIYIGIIIHECIVAVALGLNSFRLEDEASASNIPKTVMKFGIMFSSTIPVGMILGIAVGYTPGAFGKLISAIFQGLAAGTFLHVAFCELIPAELNVSPPSSDHEDDDVNCEDEHSHFHEYSSPTRTFDHNQAHCNSRHSSRILHHYDNKLFRICLIFLGFIFMAFITLVINHSD